MDNILAGIELLTLSDYHIIAPRQVHPDVEEVEQLIFQMCQDLGIYHRNYPDYTTMTAYLYPRTSKERLITAYLMMNTLWYLDDHYDRDTVNETPQQKQIRRQTYFRCAEILREGARPGDDHLLHQVFAELHRRISTLMPAAWLDRVAKAMMDHLQSSADNRQAFVLGDQVDVARYIQSRELDSGMLPTMMVVEMVSDIFLPDEVMAHPYVRMMTMRCSRIGSLTNDLFSYTKEVIRLNSDFNLLKVLMESENLTLEEALHESMLLINGIIDDFVEDAAQIPDFGDEKRNAMVAAYIAGLRDIVIASWHWQYSTNRYRSPDSPFPELRTLL